MRHDDRPLPPTTHDDGAGRVMHCTSSQGTDEGRTHLPVVHADHEGPEERRVDIVAATESMGEDNGTKDSLKPIIE